MKLRQSSEDTLWGSQGKKESPCVLGIHMREADFSSFTAAQQVMGDWLAAPGRHSHVVQQPCLHQSPYLTWYVEDCRLPVSETYLVASLVKNKLNRIMLGIMASE